MKYKKYLPAVLLLLVGFIPLFDFFDRGLPITHDGQDHVARVANFYQNLTDGNIIPRWAGNLNWGFGHPILMFLYPLPSYLASIFHFLSFSFVDSVKIVFGLSFITSGLAMYLWIQSFLGRNAGIVAGTLYMIAPYRFVDLYVRGAIGEHVAFIFPPLICYFIFKLSKKYSHLFVVGGAFSVAGLLLSHNAISLMFLPLIFLYVIYLSFTSEESRSLPRHLRGGVAPQSNAAGTFDVPPAAHLGGVISMVLLGFGIAAFFWLPAFFEGKYTLRDIVTTGEYASRFVRLEQFLYGPWSFGGTGQFSVQLGIVHWVIVAGSVVLLFLKKTAKEHKKLIGGLLIITVIALFLMIPQSSNLWQNISVLQKFQFPWRFMSVTVFSTAVLGGLLVWIIPKRFKLPIVFCITVLVLFFNKDYWHTNGYLYKVDSFFSGIYNGTTDTGESSPIWSVRFMEKRPKEHIEVVSGQATIKELGRKSSVHVYEIDATEKSRMLENTLYFPGWDVLVDGRKVEIEFQDPRHRGLMTFFVDKGKHTVYIKFGETKLRGFSNTISIVSLLIVSFTTFIILWRKRLG